MNPPEEVAPPTPQTAAFFISYTRVDEEWAEWIAWCLEEDGGYHVVVQVWDFRPGNNFVLLMQQA